MRRAGAQPPTLATLVAITGVAAMSMNVFLPSLARIAEDFGTDYGVIQLSVALYLALMGATQLVLGPLADRFGRRPVLLAAYGVFTLASLGCALATDVRMFLGSRMLQAVVYSGVTLSRAIVRDSMREERAASTISYLTLGMALVPMLSPALGGLLDATLGWRASFWLLSFAGAGATWLIWSRVGETQVGGHASLAEQVRSYPELLGDRRFWGYSLAMTFAAGTYFAYLGGAPFVGAEIFRLDPMTLGLLFGSTSLGYATGSFLSGRFSERAGVRRMILTGILTTTGAILASLGLFTVGLGSALVFFGFTVIVGVGYGMTLPNATAGMLGASRRLAGSASGLGGAMMIGGGAAISACAGAVLTGNAGAERLLLIQLASSVTSLFALALLPPARAAG